MTGFCNESVIKAGLLVPSAIEMAGPGLRKVCGSLGIPPVLYCGSCIDNSRIIHLCAMLANALGVDIGDVNHDGLNEVGLARCIDQPEALPSIR